MRTKRRSLTLVFLSILVLAGCNWFGSSEGETGTQNDEQFLRKNILEYYQMLPSALFLYEGFAEVKYDLQQKGGKWVTSSIDEYEIDPVVDIQNGYIEILDEGTGGGSIHEIITLFRKADKSPLIGISLGGFDGLYQSSQTSFYAFNQDGWENVTKSVLPGFSFSSFLDEEYVEKYLDTGSKAYLILRLMVFLPHHGTDLVVMVNESQLRFLVEHAVDLDAIENFSEKEVEELFEIIGNIKYRSMNLTWDKQSGRFYKGKRELIDDHS